MSFFYEYKKVIPLNFSASLSYYLFLALAPSFLLVYLFMSYYVHDLTILEEIIKLILLVKLLRKVENLILLYPYHHPHLFINKYNIIFYIFLFFK